MALGAPTTYRNVFQELGYSPSEVDRRIQQAWTTMVSGPAEERLVFAAGDGLAYVLDTGNDDVRTEGMSYGMMMAVQMDDQDGFDRLWRWAVKFMQHQRGPLDHYFAWSVNPDGTRRSEGPAPDGEEYFALALFFASHRWGDGQAPLDYSVQARVLLRSCVHQDELTGGDPMWDRSNGLIKFVPNAAWTDPSYHLPHFYDGFARWADEADRPFWARAAAASRSYLPKACHPKTGLAPEYAEFDGRPHRADWDYGHHKFFSDSYRVAANIGLDAAWTGGNPEWRAIAVHLLAFFDRQDPADLRLYELDGTPTDEPALHPVGLVAATAVAALAVDLDQGRSAVQRLWATPLRTGRRRYYDNCLYFFALLALSGRYRVW